MTLQEFAERRALVIARDTSLPGFPHTYIPGARGYVLDFADTPGEFTAGVTTLGFVEYLKVATRLAFAGLRIKKPAIWERPDTIHVEFDPSSERQGRCVIELAKLERVNQPQ